jgi:hypothetical protein
LEHCDESIKLLAVNYFTYDYKKHHTNFQLHKMPVMQQSLLQDTKVTDRTSGRLVIYDFIKKNDERIILLER